MKFVLPVFVFAIMSTSALPQEIQMYNTFGGARFEMDTLTLTHRQVSQILSIDPQASAEFRIARNNYSAAGIMGFGGALLIIVPVVSAGSWSETQWLVAGGGVAMLLASIPFSRAFKNRAGSAIDNFNSRHRSPASSLRPNFYLTGRGASLVIRF